jgi:type VI secretion system protein ImpG
MDFRLLDYYETELKHIREIASEFAAENPRIAERLGLNSIECADPYVERLLEGFAYLSARVQLKVDAQFPRFTQHLLNIVYPHFLAPTPSMVMVSFKPKDNEGVINGFLIPKQTSLLANVHAQMQSRCEYRTAHDVMLWSIGIKEVEYLSNHASVEKFTKLDALTEFQHLKSSVKSAIRLRLECKGSANFNSEAFRKNLNRLPLYLKGNDELPMQLYEALLSNVLGMVIQPVIPLNAIFSQLAWQHSIIENAVLPLDFGPENALLPYTPQSFQGYRWLQEYFAFPERYRFVELNELAQAWHKAGEQDTEVDIVIFLDETSNIFEHLKKELFELFCTPTINLFPKSARVPFNLYTSEYHIVPDRHRTDDFEVYQIRAVKGLGRDEKAHKQTFLPFYHANGNQVYDDNNADKHLKAQAYYSIIRVPHVIASKRQNQKTRYIGTEVYLSLVDGNEAPFQSDLYQLGVDMLCTNRHLPLQLRFLEGKIFDIQSNAPVTVDCVSPFTPPSPSRAYKDIAWKLINHLSLNYLSLLNSDAQQGAATLRELLSLYATNQNLTLEQIQGILEIHSEPIVRRMRVNPSDPIVFGRGLKITVTVDELKFKGHGVFLLGMVLDAFFAQYVSLNSFIETVLKIKNGSQERIKTWPLRLGQKQLI